MRAYWVPGVNNLGSFGRWAFAEFTAVYEIDAAVQAQLIEQVPVDAAEASAAITVAAA